VGNLTPEARKQFDVPEQVHGVVVQDVRAASPADDAGIQPGDVILEVDRKPAESASQFANEVHQNKDGKDLLMLVWSKGNSSYRTIHPDQNNQNG
jgi:serine protease Do